MCNTPGMGVRARLRKWPVRWRQLCRSTVTHPLAMSIRRGEGMEQMTPTSRYGSLRGSFTSMFGMPSSSGTPFLTNVLSSPGIPSSPAPLPLSSGTPSLTTFPPRLVFLPLVLLSSSVPSDCRLTMGRPPWATPEQTAFLESHVPKLEEEKHNHGLTAFYARVTKEFVRRWPSPVIPDGATNEETLRLQADGARGRVSRYTTILFSLR